MYLTSLRFSGETENGYGPTKLFLDLLKNFPPPFIKVKTSDNMPIFFSTLHSISVNHLLTDLFLTFSSPVIPGYGHH